jgi:hypothetical protein
MSRQHNKMSSLRDFNPHAAVLDLRREPRLHNVSIQPMLAARHVELPAMPGASHDASVKFSFAQRPALMGTHAIQRKELAVHVKQRDDAITDNRFQRAARQASVNEGDFVPRHKRVR